MSYNRETDPLYSQPINILICSLFVSVNHWIICNCCLFSFEFVRIIIIMSCAVVLCWIIPVDCKIIRWNVVKICYWMSYFLVHGYNRNRNRSSSVSSPEKNRSILFSKTEFLQKPRNRSNRFGSNWTHRPTGAGWGSVKYFCSVLGCGLNELDFLKCKTMIN